MPWIEYHRLTPAQARTLRARAPRREPTEPSRSHLPLRARDMTTTDYFWSHAKRNALAHLSATQRAEIARAQAERTLARLTRKDTSAHTDWMNECVPKLMGYGKEQDVAVAACLNMWREQWEISHPGGEDDPGPSPPEDNEEKIAKGRYIQDPETGLLQGREPGPNDDGGGGGGSKPSAGKGKVKKEDFDKAKITLNVSGGAQGEQKFIDRWNERVGIEPEQFKKQFLGGVDSTMRIQAPSSGEIEIAGSIQQGGSSVGEYQRRINLDGKSAYSAYFKLDKSATKHNIGKKVLAGNVEMYEKLGVESVGVTANIDVGGYAWAKYGYVPTQAAWNSLRGGLERKLTAGVSSSRRPGRTDTTEAEEWSWIPESQQDEVRERWMRDTQSDFYDSEVSNWRDSGQALEDASRSLASDYTTSSTPEWVNDALDKVREAREEAGEPPIPYSNAQLHQALAIEDYESRHGDGSADAEFSWDDDELRNPSTGPDPRQQTLPGIEPPDLSKMLTEDMREQITDEMVSAFRNKAERDADDIDPPDYLSDSVAEFQEEYWRTMEDEQRLEYAQRYGLADIEIERDEDDEDEESEEQLELEPAPASDPLLEAVRSSDPKSIWKIADSPKGKTLLLGTGWQGKLNLKDKEALKRFKDYVGKA